MKKWFRYTCAGLVLVTALSIGLSGQAFDAGAEQLKRTNILELQEMPVTITPDGGKLLLSDSPEMVPAYGIMYQDTVRGDVRLFFHHVNATPEPGKIIVLLVNEGEQEANVVLKQRGISGPDLNYLEVGKAAQLDYLTRKDFELICVPAKGTILLDSSLDSTVVDQNMLVNGIYDFTMDQPVKVVTMMLPVDADPAKFLAEAEVLPADSQRLRGTFDGMDRIIAMKGAYNPKEDGAVVITLADNKKDRFLAGTDATDGSRTINYGNYGVVYRLYIPSYHDQNLSVYLNPRGGEFAGGLNTQFRHQQVNTVATPYDKLFFGSDSRTDFAHLGDFTGGQSLWLTFSPPGASNLPVKVILIPNMNY
ncbi:MAG TPA: copper amine oxidase [Methylomusa anaerophila]|uniref:Copper amine oxidase-like N-terminal domain-containing protein n=1 Tax=Methylomusa anaerophila TaxID=1930071 RepID=A0A348AL11_9FIRM|nr:copper amine oxidase [Methylomusa anaerophila]BBB91759.1 hypothetical protein MAMMFC1_02443 [Methylomusa anaerophila]HML88504.1 copper amine oxidase [Methylomusa anaerophila]